MKKRLSLLLLLICTPLFAEINFNLSVTPDFSVTTGDLGEHLFDNNKTLEHNKTSLLTWQENPVLTAGISGIVSLNNFFLEPAFHAAIPMRSGSMYDYDWFMHTNICQSRSISDESLTEAYFTDADFGYEFELDKNFSLSPVIGFSYKYINFYAAKTTVYADPSRYDRNIISFDSPDAQEYNGSWITYWRESFIYWLGIKFHYFNNNKFSFDLTFKLSPYCNTISEDNHPDLPPYGVEDPEFTYRVYYQDLPSGYCSAFNLKLNAEYIFSKQMSLVIKSDLFSLGLITGPTYSSKKPGILGGRDGTSYIGASQDDITFSTGLRINLF